MSAPALNAPLCAAGETADDGAPSPQISSKAVESADAPDYAWRGFNPGAASLREMGRLSTSDFNQILKGYQYEEALESAPVAMNVERDARDATDAVYSEFIASLRLNDEQAQTALATYFLKAERASSPGLQT
ncbi:unnamed protein product [Peniophora sp. CBMAI 1063]|nr:unnamed protein product [Peniophora sp. CBMAI 1063]